MAVMKFVSGFCERCGELFKDKERVYPLVDPQNVTEGNVPVQCHDCATRTRPHIVLADGDWHFRATPPADPFEDLVRAARRRNNDQ